MLFLAVSVIWWIFLICLVMGIGAWLVFSWSIKSGQYDDIEKPARDLLELDGQEFMAPEGADTQERTQDVAQGSLGR